MLKRCITAIISILLLCGCGKADDNKDYYVFDRVLKWHTEEGDKYYLKVYNPEDNEGLAVNDWTFYMWEVDKTTFEEVEYGDCIWIIRK